MIVSLLVAALSPPPPPLREASPAICRAQRTEAACEKYARPGVDAAGCSWSATRKLCWYVEAYPVPPPPLPIPPVRQLEAPSEPQPSQPAPKPEGR